MSALEHIRPKCVQSLIKRKDLEGYIGLLISQKNKSRKKFITRYCIDQKVKKKYVDNLLKVSHIKKSEHSILKTLFSKINWGTEFVDLSSTAIFPGMQRITFDSDCSESTVSLAKSTLKEKGLITWKNRQKGNKTESNIYYFTPKIIALAQFTELCQKSSLNERESKLLGSLINILKVDFVTEKTDKQKIGAEGQIAKKANENNREKLKTVLGKLKKAHTSEQKSMVSMLEDIISNIDRAKEKKTFDFSKDSIITKEKSQIITLKKCTRGVQISDQGVQNSDPGGTNLGPIITQSNVHKRISKLNKTPLRSIKNKNTRAKIPEEFHKLFKSFEDYFSTKLDHPIKTEFIEKFKSQDVVNLDEFMLKMQYFAQDPYLSWSTIFPDRILSHFNTAIKIRNDMKKKALNSSSNYDPSIIRTDDLGEILGAFETPHQIYAWAKSPTVSYEYFKKHRTFEVQEPKELETSEDNHTQMPTNFIDLSKYPCDSPQNETDQSQHLPTNFIDLSEYPCDRPQNLPALIETDQSQHLDKINEHFKRQEIYENQKKMLEDKKNEEIRQQKDHARSLRSKVLQIVQAQSLQKEKLASLLVYLSQIPLEPHSFEKLLSLSVEELIKTLEGEPCLTKNH